MQNYEVASVQDRQTKTGKPYKVLTIRDQEGGTVENVKLWADHPDFEIANVGSAVGGVLQYDNYGPKLLNKQSAAKTNPNGSSSKSQKIEEYNQRRESSIEKSARKRDECFAKHGAAMIVAMDGTANGSDDDTLARIKTIAKKLYALRFAEHEDEPSDLPF